MTFDSKTIQAIIAYAAIVMGVLTTQLQGVKLPVWGSIILGVFGVLLHPDTSLTVPVVSRGGQSKITASNCCRSSGDRTALATTCLMSLV